VIPLFTHHVSRITFYDMTINLHIERLILDGVDVPHDQRPVLQAAVQAELARLLAADGVAPSFMAGGELARVPAEAIQLTGEGDSTQLGQQIARAVYGGISR
jgi:hypothetical protein